MTNKYGEESSLDEFKSAAGSIWEKHKRKAKIALAGLAGSVMLLGSVYTVPQDSTGVVTTFGSYSRQSKPGLHMKIPFVEGVSKVPTQRVYTEAVGFRTSKPGVKSEFIGVPEIVAGKVDNNELERIIAEEGLSVDSAQYKDTAAKVLRAEYLMLTGDLNMADVEFIYQYKIRDPVAYKFNVREQKETSRDIAESAMRIVIGDASVDEVLTMGRTEIEQEVQRKMQAKLDQYGTGLELVTVKLQSANPPERVRSSFNEVNQAIQQKQEQINKAMSVYNQEIPKAEGEALATVEQAKGYASARVNNAHGMTARFNQIYQEYKTAPSITRTRIYLEAMPTILDNSNGIYFIEDGKGGDLLLKKLDLPSATKGGAK